jgi:hypothetical protein
MVNRRVTHSGKDRDGDIIRIGHPGEPWSPRQRADAIRDIEGGAYRYYVDAAGYATDVTVVKRADGTKFLRTVADTTSKNNLDNLPDC